MFADLGNFVKPVKSVYLQNFTKFTTISKEISSVYSDQEDQFILEESAKLSYIVQGLH